MTAFSNRFSHKTPMTLLVSALLLTSTQLQATDIEPITESIADSIAGSVQQDEAEPDTVAAEVIVAENTPQQLWQDYLDAGNYYEGLNTLNGKTFLIQSATFRVRGSFDRGWIAARNGAFESAVLGAKAQMARALQTEIKSKRNLKVFRQGADLSPSDREIVKLHNQLSLVEKGQRLMSAELDAQLRRHYPDWDGTGVPAAEKQRKVETAGTALRNEIASRARGIISGATTVFQTEGYDDRGHYVVLVGIVWSQQMAQVARSLTDPELQLPKARPGQPIRQKLAALQAQDPTFLARFDGTRIWRDEKGQWVIVSVASHDRGSEDSITEDINELVARNRIVRFSAEAIESENDKSGDRSMREYADDTSADFDAEKYESTIKGIVKSTRISGAQVIKKWRGIHPISGSPMITSVMMWTPESAKLISQFTNQVSSPARQERQRVEQPSGITPRTLTGPAAEFDDF